MFELAQITGYKPTPEGTYLQILIPGKNLMEAIIDKRIRSCNVWLEDGRHISAEQRKKAYATIISIGRDVIISHYLTARWTQPGHLSIHFWIMLWKMAYRF